LYLDEESDEERDQT